VMPHSIAAVLVATWFLPAMVAEQPLAVQTFVPVEECPLVAKCCEEDCCGQGTSWDSNRGYCVYDLDSDGFNGTHSDAFNPDCVERACCEDSCCSPGTRYVFDQALCLPSGPTPGPTPTPSSECVPTTGPCVSTFTELEQAVASASSDDVIALCGNNVPIIAETAILVDQPSLSLCCSGMDSCIMESSGNDRNLMVTAPDFTVQDIIFANGTSSSDGGNMIIDAAGSHQIIGCEFRNGKAGVNGGNLAVEQADTLTIMGTSFVNGTAGDLGGGANINASRWFADECTFKANSAFAGGGLNTWFSPIEISIKDTVFDSNFAETGGGYFASALGDLRSLEILGCTFDDNEGGGAGHANLDDLSKLDLRISGNDGSGNVGDDFFECDDFLFNYIYPPACVGLTDDITSLPGPTAAPTVAPGCMSTTGYCVSNFSELEQVVAGAASNDVIAICGNGIPIVTESAIEVEQSNLSLCCSGTQDCIMASSGSDRNLLISGANFTLKDIIFMDGASTQNGGNVAFNGRGTHWILDCEFHSGHSSSNGGNLAVYDAETVTMRRSSFVNGTAGGLGGGLFVEELVDSLAVEDCIFRENTANAGGGAHMRSISEQILLKASLFESNMANFGGGYFASGLGELRKLDLIENTFNYNTNGAGQANIDSEQVYVSNVLNVGIGNVGVGMDFVCDDLLFVDTVDSIESCSLLDFP